MTRPMAALLLSTLVFPGTGHLYLKDYPRGIAVLAISLACLWVIADRVLQQASSVLTQLVSEGAVIDAGRLTDLVAQTSSGTGSLVVSTASLVLAGCWVIGIADTYRIARSQQDRNTLPHPSARQ